MAHCAALPNPPNGVGRAEAYQDWQPFNHRHHYDEGGLRFAYSPSSASRLRLTHQQLQHIVRSISFLVGEWPQEVIEVDVSGGAHGAPGGGDEAGRGAKALLAYRHPGGQHQRWV